MVSYPDIAHLVRSRAVREDSVDVHFESDCGKFSQIVTVSRDPQGGLCASGEGNPLLAWVRSALGRAVPQAPHGPVLDQGELERTTLQAFHQLSTPLTQIDGRWVAKANDVHPNVLFETQLRGSPITEPYDLDVLVRVLLEVARSNSECRVEERSFLLEVVSDEKLINRLSNAPPVTVAELAEVSSVAAKQTILMLAWTMAYADGQLDPEEMTRLTHLCRGFMLPERRVKELQLAAKLSLLGRYLDSVGESIDPAVLREHFDERAKRWGVCEENLGKLRAWYPQHFPDDAMNV